MPASQIQGSGTAKKDVDHAILVPLFLFWNVSFFFHKAELSIKSQSLLSISDEKTRSTYLLPPL